MNRSALCIQMLHILYGRSTPISKKELASLLETNPRNISEFKKELEIAGYVIHSTSGVYGGYHLDEKSIFPSLALNDKEKIAINEALTYLNVQNNFIDYDSFVSAMDKVKAKLNHREKSKDTIYMADTKSSMSEKEAVMLEIVQKARDHQTVLQFDYLSTQSNIAEVRKVHPYEIVVSNDGCYLLAFDITANKKHDYKYFKIIEERMQNVRTLEITFIKDSLFSIRDHIGKNTLMKDVYEVSLAIYGKQARLVNEKALDNIIEKTFKDDILYVHFMMEGKMRLHNFILSLGKDVKVLSPLSLQQEIKAILTDALLHYQ